MGLDMYLTKKIWIGAQYDHNDVKGEINLTRFGKPIKNDIRKVSYIEEAVGYWRKANQIHRWFVDNVQDGKDDCNSYYVSMEKLVELKDLCLKVLETKDPTLLPPSKGFFFGSTIVDDYYFEDLTRTVEMIESLDPDGHYEYRASW